MQLFQRVYAEFDTQVELLHYQRFPETTTSGGVVLIDKNSKRHPRVRGAQMVGKVELHKVKF